MGIGGFWILSNVKTGETTRLTCEALIELAKDRLAGKRIEDGNRLAWSRIALAQDYKIKGEGVSAK